MRNTVWLLVFTFLLMFAIGFSVTISPLLAFKMGASWIDIGLMGAAWGLVFTSSAFLTGRISDRIGRKPILATSALTSALAAFLFLRASSVIELIAVRGLEGFAWACFWPPMEALATETSHAERTGRIMGLVTTAYSLAFAASSILAGLVTSLFGFAYAFMSYLGISTLAMPAILVFNVTKPQLSPHSVTSGSRSSKLFSGNLVLGYFLGFAYTFGFANVWTLFSVYSSGIGVQVAWIGVAFAVFWVGRIFGATIAGSISDIFGRKKTVLLVLAVGSVGFVAIGIAQGWWLLVVGALLAGFSVGGVFPVNVSIISDDVDPNRRGSVMGFYEMACAVGFMIASGAGGLVAQVISPRAPYAVSALVFLGASLILAALLRER